MIFGSRDGSVFDFVTQCRRTGFRALTQCGQRAVVHTTRRHWAKLNSPVILTAAVRHRQLGVATTSQAASSMKQGWVTLPTGGGRGQGNCVISLSASLHPSPRRQERRRNYDHSYNVEGGGGGGGNVKQRSRVPHACLR